VFLVGSPNTPNTRLSFLFRDNATTGIASSILIPSLSIPEYHSSSLLCVSFKGLGNPDISGFGLVSVSLGLVISVIIFQVAIKTRPI
jgi:hypothetical protein